MTIAYVVVLLWLDHDKGLLSGFGRVSAALPVLLSLSFVSYLVRYARWHWLLLRAGVGVSATRGFVAYMSGFAFTITPGKVGELVRIRYFQPQDVPAETVIAAFVYERALDVLVVLGLASIFASSYGVFGLALAFVALICMAVTVLAIFPHLCLPVTNILKRMRLRRLANGIEVLSQGFAQTRRWLTAVDLLIGLGAGLLAWGLSAYSFVFLLGHLELNVEGLIAFSIYPLAILVGAASMIPGGIGSTEVVLVVLLADLGVDFVDGAIAAIGIRLSNLWFATILGLSSMFGLEVIAKRVRC